MPSAAHKRKTKLAADLRETFSLDDFKIFWGLSRSEVNCLIEAGVMRSVAAGKLLFRKGDKGEKVYLILKGTIQIVDEYDKHRKSVAEVGPGEFFGEMAMFERVHTRSTHAIAKEHSQLLVLENDVLEKLIDKKMPKQFLKNIIAALCHRIRANNAMYMRARYYDKSSKTINWQG